MKDFDNFKGVDAEKYLPLPNVRGLPDYDELYDDDEYWGGSEESDTCPECNGTGLDFTGLEDCDYCFGMGYKWW